MKRREFLLATTPPQFDALCLQLDRCLSAYAKYMEEFAQQVARPEAESLLSKEAKEAEAKNLLSKEAEMAKILQRFVQAWIRSKPDAAA